ncbi:hypothetical protein I553_5885, partial [Mycobacterium xenopi 4042]
GVRSWRIGVAAALAQVAGDALLVDLDPWGVASTYCWLRKCAWTALADLAVRGRARLVGAARGAAAAPRREHTLIPPHQPRVGSRPVEAVIDAGAAAGSPWSVILRAG